MYCINFSDESDNAACCYLHYMSEYSLMWVVTILWNLIVQGKGKPERWIQRPQISWLLLVYDGEFVLLGFWCSSLLLSYLTIIEMLSNMCQVALRSWRYEHSTMKCTHNNGLQIHWNTTIHILWTQQCLATLVKILVWSTYALKVLYVHTETTNTETNDTEVIFNSVLPEDRSASELACTSLFC